MMNFSEVGGFFKRLLSSTMSFFDITSDLVNSCDFLGHNASATIIDAGKKMMDMVSRDDLVSNNISDFKHSYHLRHVTSYEGCKLPKKFNSNPRNGYNATNIDRLTGLLYNSLFSDHGFVCGSEGVDEHVIWGTLGIIIMFIPGLVAIGMFMFNKPSPDNKFRKGKYPHDLIVIFLMAMFPLTVLIFQFYTTLTCQGEVCQGYMAIGVALEAFVESFLQLILQTFTICYGYEITYTQIVAIFGSFFILSKTSIDLDLEMNHHFLSTWDIVMHFTNLGPGYAATIAFRVLSFSITMAFLRLWSIIPISLLFLELVATCYICFRKLRQTNFGYAAYLPLIITNLGVTNVGTIGANQFMKDEMKQECGEVVNYYKETDKFIKISSIMSFIHHSVVIATIVGLITYNPCYFQHWTCPKFILNNYKGYLHEHMHCVASDSDYSGFSRHFFSVLEA